MIYFSEPLVKATLIKRYKRFFVDAKLENGEVVTAHCANTGSLRSCYVQDGEIFLLPINNPKRKLRYSWELSLCDNSLIGINTTIPNRVIADALANQSIEELREFKQIRTEASYGTNSRIDFLLSKGEGSSKKSEFCYVEVKNCTLRIGDAITFPDAVTTRGQKHLDELTKLVKQGYKCVMFYFVNRTDGDSFRICHEIDKAYHERFCLFLKEGGAAIAYRSTLSTAGIGLGSRIEFSNKA